MHLWIFLIRVARTIWLMELTKMMRWWQRQETAKVGICHKIGEGMPKNGEKK